MAHLRRYRVLLWQWIRSSVSTKLSIALVLGLALIPAAAARRGTATRLAGDRQNRSPSSWSAETKLSGRPARQPSDARTRREARRRRGRRQTRERPEHDDSLRAARRRQDARAHQVKREEAASRPATRPHRHRGAGAPSRRRSPRARQVPTPMPSRPTTRRRRPPSPSRPSPTCWTDAEVIAALKECVRLLGADRRRHRGRPARQARAVRHAGTGDAEAHRLRRQQGRDQPAGHAELPDGGGPARLGREDLAAGGARDVRQPDRAPAQRVGLFLPQPQRQPPRHRQAERARQGQRHRHRRLRHGRRPHHRGVALLGPDRARHPRGGAGRGRARQGRARRARPPKPREAAKAEPAKIRPCAAAAPSPPSRRRSRRPTSPPRPSPGGESGARRAELRSCSRRPTSARRTPRPFRCRPSGANEAAKTTAEAAFLRRLHKGACGTFGTVLGPEANEAHRDHFHFDLAARRRNAFCE